MSLPQAQTLMSVRPWGPSEWNPGLWVIGVTPSRYVCESRALTWHFSPLLFPYRPVPNVIPFLSVPSRPPRDFMSRFLQVLSLYASSFTVLPRPDSPVPLHPVLPYFVSSPFLLCCVVPYRLLPSRPILSCPVE